MLVLTIRKDDGGVWIGDDVRVEVIESRAGKIRLGFSAPKSIRILRDIHYRKGIVSAAKEATDGL